MVVATKHRSENLSRSGRGNESERQGLVASSTTGSDSYFPHDTNCVGKQQGELVVEWSTQRDGRRDRKRRHVDPTAMASAS